MSDMPRKSLQELRSEAFRGGSSALQIAGKPADECPYCGCSMFVDGTRPGEGVTFRYVVCRNQACGKRFFTKQQKAVIVREVTNEELPSRSGQPMLTVYKDAS